MIHSTCDMCGGRSTMFIETSSGAYCHHCGSHIQYRESNKLKERTKKINKIMIRIKEWKTL